MFSGTRKTAGAAVATAMLLALAAPVSAPAAGWACARPEFVPAVGLACRLPNGLLQLVLDDGTSITTHGADPISLNYRQVAAGTVTSTKTACAKDPKREFHGQLLYVRASDKADRYTQVLTGIRNAMYYANGFLRAEAREFGRVMTYRMLCSGTEVSVQKVTLPVKDLTATLTFGEIVSELRKLGYTNPLAHYWIWYDGRPRAGAAGVGTYIGDDSNRASNANNLGPSYAATFGEGASGYGWKTMMHENGHNMGAVQFSAQNSNQAGHCNDGSDVMCYAEGAWASFYDDNKCSSTHYDCGHNDYFNPKPSSSSYLASHWNIGSPLNRFMTGCTYATGVLTAGAAGQAVDGQTSRDHAIPTGCAGRPFSISGVFVQPPEVWSLFANVPFVAQRTAYQYVMQVPVPDFNVCWFAGTKQLSCTAGQGNDTGKIPSGTTKARVILNAGAQAIYVLNAV